MTKILRAKILKGASILSLVFLLSLNHVLNAQITREFEIKVTDAGLYFDGEARKSDYHIDNPGFEYYFGRRITPHGDCIKKYGDFLFLTWYLGGEENKNVMLSRLHIPTQTLETVKFPHTHVGFRHTYPHIGDSHNTIAVGVCPIDSTVHLLYDMHSYSKTDFPDSYFNYQVSFKGAANAPVGSFTIDLFNPRQTYLNPIYNYSDITYPNFFLNGKDEDKVRAEAEKSLEQNLGHHMKFKMYGDKEVDLKLLRIIRKVLGPEAIVISDVNKGYKKWKSLEELADILNLFRDNGLNAIEDPAHLTTEQWIALQELTGELDLIPDAPMRPAWKGIERLQSGMGRIVNLHPSTMGSFNHTALLANKVQQIGAKVMIGDDSLAGPACSAWQQIAIGSGAAWVEAIEKKEDSENYLKCVISSATKKEANGYYSLKPAPGFGLQLDEDRLKKVAAMYIEV